LGLNINDNDNFALTSIVELLNTIINDFSVEISEEFKHNNAINSKDNEKLETCVKRSVSA